MGKGNDTQDDKHKNKRNSKKGGTKMDTTTSERPCTVLESIEESLREITQYKKGKTKLNSLSKSLDSWKQLSKEVENEDNESK